MYKILRVDIFYATYLQINRDNRWISWQIRVDQSDKIEKIKQFDMYQRTNKAQKASTRDSYKTLKNVVKTLS